MENWKDVIGYEGLYQVSDLGNIRRYAKIRIRNEKGQCIGWVVSKDLFEEHFLRFDDKFIDKLISRMDQNQEIFEKILDDKSFGDLVKELMMRRIFKKLNK